MEEKPVEKNLVVTYWTAHACTRLHNNTSEYTAYDRFRENGPYGKIPTE